MKCEECGNKFYLFKVDLEYPLFIEAEDEAEANEELHRRWNWGFKKLRKNQLPYKNQESILKTTVCEDCRNE
tara:strand:+ start:364 stop:579 length:216 start_codon:yes stop_codon:yes gene_type:complete